MNNASSNLVSVKSAIDELKSLYRHGAYEEAFHLAADIIRFAPHNKVAKKILIRSEKKFTARHHTRVLVFICIFLFLIISGGFLLSKEMRRVVKEENKKIKNIVSEIGQIHSQNLVFFNQIKENRNDLNRIKLGLEKSYKENDDELKKTIYLQNKKIKKELETLKAEGELEEIISKQEEILEKQEKNIKSLLQENETAEKKISLLSKGVNKEFFLVLGVHGNLADTIILASLDTESQEMNLLSIPRDLQVNGRKINEYFSLYGPETMKSYISEVAGIDVGNYFVFDFDSFEGIIDYFGGIEVEVEKDIYDPYFPNGPDSYRVFEVKKGKHHFSGQEALSYARSRKSTSDFDRSQRQQSIIKALIRKAKDRIKEEDLTSLLALVNEVFSSIKTDSNIFDIAKKAYQFSELDISLKGSLDKSQLIYSTKNERGQYIILPKKNDFEALKEYIQDSLGV